MVRRLQEMEAGTTVVSGTLRSLLFILLVGCPFIVFEWRFGARRVAYRKVVLRDLGACLVAVLLSLGAAFLLRLVLTELDVGAWLALVPEVPVWAAIPIAILGTDFALYWMHRLVHTSPLWRLHRWHHVPRHMYWLMGMRTSMLQQALYGLIPLLLAALRMSAAFVAAYGLLGTIVNHWMHANLRFRWRWLEAVLVTPRIHHVHHSIDPRHRNRNFGSMFCIWDRMFGTFFDPDDVQEPLAFGIPEVVAGPRIVVGL